MVVGSFFLVAHLLIRWLFVLVELLTFAVVDLLLQLTSCDVAWLLREICFDAVAASSSIHLDCRRALLKVDLVVDFFPLIVPFIHQSCTVIVTVGLWSVCGIFHFGVLLRFLIKEFWFAGEENLSFVEAIDSLQAPLLQLFNSTINFEDWKRSVLCPACECHWELYLS